MPEVGDCYKGAEILLPRGDEIARGNTVAQSHDSNGNFIGGAHTNLILSSRIYQPMSLLS